jgi:hypothetical protein
MTMALEYATGGHYLDNLEDQRSFLTRELGYCLDPRSRATIEQYIEQRFNPRVENRGRPELRIGAAVVSARREAFPRADIEVIAREAGRYLAASSPSPAIDSRLEQLQAVFREIRTTFWPRLPGCRISIERRRDDKRLGTFSRSEGIWINPLILSGELKCVRDGSGDPLGLLRFAADVLLHESIHLRLAGRIDQYDDHGAAFHAEAFVATKKLTPVRRTWQERLTIHNCELWPDMCRPRSYYRGAVVRLCRG